MTFYCGFKFNFRIFFNFTNSYFSNEKLANYVDYKGWERDDNKRNNWMKLKRDYRTEGKGGVRLTNITNFEETVFFVATDDEQPFMRLTHYLLALLLFNSIVEHFFDF